MIITNSENNLPSKFILEDIICRDGESTDNDFTPISGIADWVKRELNKKKNLSYSSFLRYIKTTLETNRITGKKSLDFNPLNSNVSDDDAGNESDSDSESGSSRDLGYTLEDVVESKGCDDAIKRFLRGYIYRLPTIAKDEMKRDHLTCKGKWIIDDDGDGEFASEYRERREHELSDVSWDVQFKELVSNLVKLREYSIDLKYDLFSILCIEAENGGYSEINNSYKQIYNGTVLALNKYGYLKEHCFLIQGTSTGGGANNNLVWVNRVRDVIYGYGSEKNKIRMLMQEIFFQSRMLGFDLAREYPLQYYGVTGFEDCIWDYLEEVHLPKDTEYMLEHKSDDPELKAWLTPEKIKELEHLLDDSNIFSTEFDNKIINNVICSVDINSVRDEVEDLIATLAEKQGVEEWSICIPDYTANVIKTETGIDSSEFTQDYGLLCDSRGVPIRINIAGNMILFDCFGNKVRVNNTSIMITNVDDDLRELLRNGEVWFSKEDIDRRF